MLYIGLWYSYTLTACITVMSNSCWRSQLVFTVLPTHVQHKIFLERPKFRGGSRESVWGANPWRAREREPIWGSRAEPPVGSRGKAPGQGVRGEAPWSWRHFSKTTANFTLKFVFNETNHHIGLSIIRLAYDEKYKLIIIIETGHAAMENYVSSSNVYWCKCKTRRYL